LKTDAFHELPNLSQFPLYPRVLFDDLGGLFGTLRGIRQKDFFERFLMALEFVLFSFVQVQLKPLDSPLLVLMEILNQGNG
jgi:hypothetical protein